MSEKTTCACETCQPKCACASTTAPAKEGECCCGPTCGCGPSCECPAACACTGCRQE